jgi:hypothetical protein
MDELIKEFGGVFELRGHAGKFNIKSTYYSHDEGQQVIIGKLIEDGPNHDYLRCSVIDLRKKVVIIDPLLIGADPVFLEPKIEPKIEEYQHTYYVNELGEKKSIQEYFVTELMENFPDACEGSCLRCVRWKYKLCEYTFVDDEAEEPTQYKLDLEKLLKAIPLMFSNKWGMGLTAVPKDAFFSKDNAEDLLCNFDAYDMQAFIQLAIFKQVIFG